MKIPGVRSAVVETAHSRSDARTPSGGPAGSCATVHAVLIALLGWAALLCAGVGNTVGAVSQTLVGKLAFSAQYLQRQGGSISAPRAVHREIPAVAAAPKIAKASGAVVDTHAGGAVPAGGNTLPAVTRQAETRVPAETGPRPAAQHRSPPSRAPPRVA